MMVIRGVIVILCGIAVLAVYCLLYVGWRWLFPIRCRVCTYPCGRPVCLDCKSIEADVAAFSEPRAS